MIINTEKTNTKLQTFYCNCGCNNGVIFKVEEDDNTVELCLVSDLFYEYQHTGLTSLKERMKRIWDIIRGKEFSYFSIMINKNELPEFKEFIAKL